jgi:hypothetical protein
MFWRSWLYDKDFILTYRYRGLRQLLSDKMQSPDLACFSVGAYEHREAAISVCLINRYRGLAVLVRSYR